MTRFFTLILVFAACFGSTELLAQDPIISIQGTLKDANGAAVADGERSVIFRLYQEVTGGTAIWEETAMVNVIGGIYSHNLGTVTPLVEGNFATTLYLGVEVGGLELSPRTEMTYAPYALSVVAAQKVAQQGCSGQVGDVKYSILNPTQFAEQNGDCWIPMDGRPIPGTALATYGHANVPDMSGLFIRATEYNDGNDPDRSPMAAATLQGEAFKSHNHEAELAGEHVHDIKYKLAIDAWVDNNFRESVSFNDNIFSPLDLNHETEPEGEHTHAISSVGGSETRPKNMNFYIYIRVD